MNRALFDGKFVKLTEDDPAVLAKAFVIWFKDTELSRLLDSDPPRTWSFEKIKQWMEKDLEKQDPENIFFSIRTLGDDQLIGFIGLLGIAWNHGDAWVAISIGEREYWGQGYGTDAMRVLQRYAFEQLNLHRLTLLVFEYNHRAQKSYEKSGFKVEGRQRETMRREGHRWDWIYMGILKEEWKKNRKLL